MIISIVIAVSENGVIGINNKLPWKLHDDMKHFRNLTMGHFIVMGRKTFESIGKPLPGRINIVLSKNSGFAPEGIIVKKSLPDAFNYAENDGQQEIFIIGGGGIYNQSLPYADKLYYTKVMGFIEGDTYFSSLKWDEWEVISVQEFQKGEKNDHSYQIIEMIRKTGKAK